MLGGIITPSIGYTMLGARAASSAPANSDSGSAGSGALSGAASFEGAMCEFAIMGDALTGAEVLALYNSYPAPAEYKVLADSWDREVR